MPPLLFSYSFLYYSTYQYCLKVWSFSKDWPEFYACIIISVFSCFLLGGLSFLSLAIFNFDFLNAIAFSKGLDWMPSVLSNIWYYLLILFFNFYYFMLLEKWEACVKKYDNYPPKTLSNNYWLSALVFVFVVVFYLGSAFFLERGR